MGRVLEEVVLQGLGLMGAALILVGIQGYHVVERTHFHSFHNSYKHWASISRVSIHIGLAGMVIGVICKLVRIPVLVRFTVRDGTSSCLIGGTLS